VELPEGTLDGQRARPSLLGVRFFSELKALRLTAGMSQGELARAVGVSRETINAIEARRSLPSLPLALALATLLDTTVETLFDAGGLREWDGTPRWHHAPR
jgi:putative transcriptional regulator